MLVPETKPALAASALSVSRRAASLWKEIVEPVQPFLDQVASTLTEQIKAEKELQDEHEW